MMKVKRLSKYVQAGMRLMALMLIMIMTISLAVPSEVQAAALESPSGLHSHHAYVAIDAYSGRTLVAENSTKKVYPASTTKLMTSIVILERAKKKGISLNHKVTITQSMLNQVEPDLESYHMKAGQAYTLRTLMNMILISSYGDAAYAAAIAVFGSVSGCVSAMNAKVKAMGLKGTSFDNVAGLDIGNGYYHNYTTAADMAKIAQYAMNINTIAGIVAKAHFQVTQANGTKGRTITSTNDFYISTGYDKNLFTIVGTKTGTTRAAGYVFAGTAVDSEGHKVISVYMGSYSDTARFTDTNIILRTIFRAVKNGELALRTKNTYPVYLMGNKATSGSMTWATCTYGKKSKLPKCTYKRTGYTFVGWNTKKNGTGKNYPKGTGVKNLISRKEAYGVLYAQWKLTSYKIRYHLNGGTNSAKNPTTYTIKKTVKLKNPKRSGYTFDGWYTDASLKKKYQVTEIAAGTTGKVVLYAKWTENPENTAEDSTGESVDID